MFIWSILVIICKYEFKIGSDYQFKNSPFMRCLSVFQLSFEVVLNIQWVFLGHCLSRNVTRELVFAVALYAISAVYFAGVMVRLMLTLTPVVCMLSAIAFSNVFEHYLGDDMKRENPPVEDSSDEDDKRNPGNLYDKVGNLK